MTLAREMTVAIAGLLVGALAAFAILLATLAGYDAAIGPPPEWLGSVVGLALAPIPVGAMLLAVNRWSR